MDDVPQEMLDLVRELETPRGEVITSEELQVILQRPYKYPDGTVVTFRNFICKRIRKNLGV